MAPASQPTARRVARVVAAERTLEGGGFEVIRPFPTRALDLLDPFLLLDEMAPHTTAPGTAIGAPDHPHRGFETVTYILDGEVEHRDSAGNHGIIGPGDVQWMTAGDGIVHSEMPSERIQRDGGRGHGVQLWVNLPARLKRTTPRYQALPAERLAVAEGPGWRAIVLAGDLLDVQGPADTHTPVGVARLSLDPGVDLDIDVAAGHTAAVYAFSGSAVVGPDDSPLAAQHLAVFERSAGPVRLSAGIGRFEAFLLTGEPIAEPVARYGPFVMNTRAEIEEAVDDFANGRMGSIPAQGAA